MGKRGVYRDKKGNYCPDYRGVGSCRRGHTTGKYCLSGQYWLKCNDLRAEKRLSIDKQNARMRAIQRGERSLAIVLQSPSLNAARVSVESQVAAVEFNEQRG